MSQSELFNKDYFDTGCGIPYERSEHWLRFFAGIADRIVSTVTPGTVLDAGCAMGFLVEALRNREIEAFGVDISSYAIGQVYETVRPFCRVASVLDPFPQRYDLIVCIEVLEHLEKDESEKAVVNLCAHTDDIIFSSSPDDHNESTHFNVQPPEYWAALFAQQGFYRDLDYDAGYITSWAVRFRRRSEPAHRIVREYERAHWQLLKENKSLRKSYNETLQQTHALKKERDELREEHDTFLSKKEADTARVPELQNTISELSVDIKKLQEKLGETADEHQALTAQLAVEQDEKAALRKDYLAIETALNIQTKELNQLQEASREFDRAREETVHAREQAEEQLAEARYTLAQIQSSRAWKFALVLRKIRTTLFPVKDQSE